MKRSRRAGRASAEARTTPAPSTVSAIPKVSWAELGSALELAALAALFVTHALLTTDAPAELGNAAVGVLLWWLLLLAWCLGGFLRGGMVLRLGRVEAVLAVYLAWQSASVLANWGDGNGRAALNAIATHLSLGAAYFLTRHLVTTPSQARSLYGAMIALGAGIAVFALYQAFYDLPKLRAEFAGDVGRAMVMAGHDPSDPQLREQFRNRLESVEPPGPYALTNSLAGYLVPWLTAVLAVAAGGRIGGRARTDVAVFGLAGLLGFALLLTKSRTGWLAAGCGVLLCAAYDQFHRRRVDWRWPAVCVAAAGVLVFVVGIGTGWLQAKEFRDALTSLTFRFAYWRASVGMIAARPWFGCGPGHFREHYAAHKDPQASEMISDPHNFLLEIGSTAGAPAMLAFVGFLAVGLGVLWRRQTTPATGVAGEEEVAPSVPESARSLLTPDMAVMAGGLAGAALAFLIAPLSGFALHPAMLFLGFPAAALAWWGLRDWIAHGEWTPWQAALPAAALLAHLVASGGIGFPNVAQTVWLTVAVAVGLAESTPTSRLILSRGQTLALVGWAAALVVTYDFTVFRPVLMSRSWLSLAAGATTPENARDHLHRAATADPLSPTAWRLLAQHYWQTWMAQPDDAAWSGFVAASEQYLASDSRDHKSFATHGEWLVRAYGRRPKPELLHDALAAYAKAANLSPYDNRWQAEVALLAERLGDHPTAQAAARRALELDAIKRDPHQRLERLHLTTADLWPPASNMMELLCELAR